MAAKQVICDTDVMIDYLDRINARYLTTKATLEEIGLDNIFISAVTKMELICGAINKTELAKIIKNIGRFNVIPVDATITYKTISLVQTYSLSHTLSIPDGFIAATSIESGLELFTYNTKDCKFIPGIKLFKY